MSYFLANPITVAAVAEARKKWQSQDWRDSFCKKGVFQASGFRDQHSRFLSCPLLMMSPGGLVMISLLSALQVVPALAAGFLVL